MNPQKSLQNLIEGALFAKLSTRNFVAVMGVKNPHEVAATLREVDSALAYRGISGLHNLRWTLFYPNKSNDGSVTELGEEQALVLALIFDGRLDDILNGLLAKPELRVREILEHCFGFDEGTNVASFLRERETPTGYCFRDLGPLILPPKREGKPSLWRDFLYSVRLASSSGQEPDPTLHHINEAEQIRQRFEDFYADHSDKSPEELRAAFLEAFDDAQFPFPITELERRHSDEETWVRHMIDTARKRQEAAAFLDADGAVHRDVHAKSHGLLEATFQVLPPENPKLRVGLFAAPGSYRALLRPSNGEGKVQADARRDARGLALRVLLPPAVDGRELQYLLSGNARGKQDFVLMNSPVFFANDIKTLALLSATDRIEGTLQRLLGVLALAARPGGLRRTMLLVRSISTRLKHPLAANFHSTTPYRFGNEHIVKYSIEPAPQRSLATGEDPTDPNFLADNLRASLEGGGVQLRFFVHVLSATVAPQGYRSIKDVVEDATIDWGPLGARKVHVANINIGKQNPSTAERYQQAEESEFNPWNALVEHQPLGSLNRARLSAYRASQRYRAARVPVEVAANAAE